MEQPSHHTPFFSTHTEIHEILRIILLNVRERSKPSAQIPKHQPLATLRAPRKSSRSPFSILRSSRPSLPFRVGEAFLPEGKAWSSFNFPLRRPAQKAVVMRLFYSLSASTRCQRVVSRTVALVRPAPTNSLRRK